MPDHKYDTQFVNSLTPEMEKTIRLLQNSRNPVASDVLAAGLEGPPSALRQRIVQALCKRNDEAALRHLTHRFDSLDSTERAYAADRASKIRLSMHGMLTSTLPRMVRAGVAAACHFGFAENIDRLIQIAENTADPQSIFAQDELMDWAGRLGTNSRLNGSSSDARLTMLYALRSSMDRYPQHQSSVLLDAFVACMHWDDAIVHTILSDANGELSKLVLRSLRWSMRNDVLDFLGGFLWRRVIPSAVTEVLKERSDGALGSRLGELASKNINATVRHNLTVMPPMESLFKVAPTDTFYTPSARIGAWTLLAYSDMSRKTILAACEEFLKLEETWAHPGVCEILRTVPPLEWNDQGDGNRRAGASQENYTQEMLKLLEIHPLQPGSVQAGIARLFSGFSYDQLCKHLDRWDESMLFNAAWIIRTLEIGWEQRLAPELVSPSPIRRLRATRTLKYLGIPEFLTSQIYPLIYDAYDEVRVHAIEALSISGRPEAEEYLPELLGDISSDVREAARAGLELLHETKHSTSSLQT